MSSSEEKYKINKEYIETYVDPIMKVVMTKILKEKPDNVLEYLLNWVENQLKNPTYKSDYQKILQQVEKYNKEKNADNNNDNKVEEPNIKNKDAYEKPDITSSEDHSEDEAEIAALDNHLNERKSNAKKKQSVSAECFGKFNKLSDFKPRVIEKSESQLSEINETIKKCFFLHCLEEKQKNKVIDAIEVKEYKQGDRIINQGDDGNELYLVGKGNLKCYKKIDNEEKLVKEYAENEAFGELALLYNTPRQASVVADSDCLLYILDRETFSNIVKYETIKQREKYDEFLKRVDILKNLDEYERNKLCDCLEKEEFSKDNYVIKEGEEGSHFYLIIEGTVDATKTNEKGESEKVFEFKENDYFGELALLNDDKRQANIVVTSDKLTVAKMERAAFKRLLGSVENIMKRNAEKYNLK